MKRRKLTILAAVTATWAGSAMAANEEPICADRPSKSTGECTVPAGHWQVETSLVDWTHDHSGGATTNFKTFGSSLIKYGLGDRADIELGITPLEILRVSGGGTRERATGFGDTLVRVKYKLTADDAPILVALDPYVKVPTANHRLGNGKVEGGVVAPMSSKISDSLTLSVDPEVDWLADEDGHGHHAAMVQVFNVAAQFGKLTLSGELWGQWDWDPSGTQKQRSADASVAYLVKNDLQVDAGANFGLNRQTPDIELYAGISKRF